MQSYQRMRTEPQQNQSVFSVEHWASIHQKSTCDNEKEKQSMNPDRLCSGCWLGQPAFVSENTFDVATAAMGNVSEKTEKRQARRKKEGKGKKKKI